MTDKPTRLVVLGLLVGCLAASAPGADWPTYRGDNNRSGVSGERLGTGLSPQWVFLPTHPPSHAWPDPQPKPIEEHLELPRMRFDDAFHVAAAGGMVYFGSSADNKVYALDGRTGDIRWEFYTGAPVRLAPAVWRGKVYVGSDDGKVYCLSARDGRVVWTFKAAPSDEMVLGSGKMISLWPVRTGVLVDGGVAYFGAGVFPSEGLYLYAADAETGKRLWTNDTYGQGGMGTISPQGYLLASRDRLFVPSGRTVPAAFSRTDGALLFHRKVNWRTTGLNGGTYNVLAGNLLLAAAEQIVALDASNGRVAFTEGLGARVPTTGQRRLAMDGKLIYVLTGEELTAADSSGWAAATRVTHLKSGLRIMQKQARTNPSLQQQVQLLTKEVAKAAARYESLNKKSRIFKWRTACQSNDSMVLTRGAVFAGGRNVVQAFDTNTGRQVWSAKVAGRARGLAVADGRLLVSTDTGAIYCFAPGAGGRGRKVAPKIAADPFSKAPRASRTAVTADTILRGPAPRRGYALFLGGDGREALKLAKRTGLVIYLVQPDATAAAAARKALTAAGVYGAKVVVMHRPLDKLPLPDYFANLIVCSGPGDPPTPPGEVLRMLKPCGGIAYVARAQSATAGGKQDWLKQFRGKLADLGEKNTTVSVRAGGVRITRGPLAGAGSWTHQYANAANTASSDDELVRGPIGILWYGKPGPGRMPSRHASNSAPLAVGGRMFVQGENVVMAYDAYNGLALWEREIPGALRVGLKTGCSNLAADSDSLYVAVDDKCLRLDGATGRTRMTYKVPSRGGRSAGRWHYVARAGGLLYGSSGGLIFALDARTGAPRWTHQAGALMPSTITIGGGQVFFVDRKVTKAQQAQAVKDVSHTEKPDRRGKPARPDVRLVVALDADTGRESWKRPQYVSDCVGISKGGGELTMMYADGILLLCGQPWNGHFWKEFFAGGFSRRSLIALSARSGSLVWSGRKGYRSRPLIVGDRIIAEPWAHDLQTGAEKLRVHPVTGAGTKWQISRPGHHCGNIVASPHALFCRSGVTAYYDLEADSGTAHFGSQRPGCWINCIPANGVVMMPEASSGCVCPYALQCTIVFRPRGARRVWGMYSAAGAMTPVRRLAINFGAPGDRKDSAGRLWLAHPRPYDGRLVLKPSVNTKAPGGGFFQGNADFLKLAGTNDAWIYASGCEGLQTCTVALDEAAGPGRKYTVRLYFAETKETDRGRRVFDVALQGRTVLKGFDIARQAGGPGRAVVKEFKGVHVKDILRVTLDSQQGKTLLCGLEAVAEQPPATGSTEKRR